jgi:hypothetical protein
MSLRTARDTEVVPFSTLAGSEDALLILEAR